MKQFFHETMFQTFLFWQYFEKKEAPDWETFVRFREEGT